ncbi:MAG: 50S ribosomal protein L23 [Candidatus Sungbacteria bacterium]|uniref:Large ribosomal subunit protein uL23 n=1 Tax=Candidatus Sungiibacteriota bacterium TaxID=2750080 RepID=A0A932YVY2_9BACT|nr:50S ribosomal protein L23 [Candidatus Sungbacteria bacterium]
MYNPFRKSKRVVAPAAARPKPERPGALKPARPAGGPAAPAPVKAADVKVRRFIGVITSPHQTEKAAAGAAQGWYTFRVQPGANKITVRRAIEERYGVAVERVRMLSNRPKAIRLGRIQGTVPGFKKAMVKVRAGQSIELA